MITNANNTTKTKLVSIRIPEALFEIISQKADLDHRSISNYITKILMDELDTTEFLLASKTNRNRITESIKQYKTGKKIVKSLEELQEFESQE
jgi:hypothetical protein